MRDIEGKIKCGELSLEINCDSSQLDEALRKMDLLIQKAQQARALDAGVGVLTVGLLGATALVDGPKKLSRRGLLGLGWFR